MMKKSEISKLIRPNIRSLKSYGAKEIRCKVKLDANESPFSPLPAEKLAANGKLLPPLNRYPDPEGKELKKILAKQLGVSANKILLGNGSDEIISCLITTIGGPVMFPVPTFSMYGIISAALGEKTIAVPLDKEFDLDTEKILAAIKKEKPKLVFLSSPNNPTGNCFSSDRISKIIRASVGIVVVDEAYLPFAGRKGFLPMLRDFPNLVILKTMSKIGFAALRLGYMIADEAITSELEKVRLPYNVNSLSQAVAVMGMKNPGLMEKQTREVVSERERLMKALSSIAGVKTFPSEANFILFRTPDADITFDILLKHGILIKNMNMAIPNSMRVTVGNRKENDLFINALRKAIRHIKREAK
jgi:histidinol-phosphate aminotransferase